MKRHWNYLKYLLRHKWFVAVAGRKLGLGWWRVIIHDWHKFLPDEWFPYAETFYAKDGTKRYEESPAFARAWNLHQKRGRHHWQHWLITWDRGSTEPLRIEQPYLTEMVSDWLGAGRAITGKWGAFAWYQKNKETIKLHPGTRHHVEVILCSSEVRQLEMQP